jgi:hypothetical protein
MSGQGGLLNLKSEGDNNRILLGNPSINHFKAKYSKTNNFGKQAFRIDYSGQRDLRLTEPSTFQFTIPRNADLLLDTFLCIQLPDIWSPIYHPVQETNYKWSSYDFKWIEDIGMQMIKEVIITSGAFVIAKYSGNYLSNAVERDFSAEKKDLFNRASGNTLDLNDPVYVNGHENSYPSAYFTSSAVGSEPSLRGRELYIPINTWFTTNHKCAFPLIAMKNNILQITITLRPIQELFRVRDVFDMENNNPYIQPDFNQQQFSMYRFLQTPPSVEITPENYANKIQIWNADIHLIADYVFLSEKERIEFAKETQVYLVKDVYEYFFENKVGSSKSQLYSNGMISNWMFYFQRNDVNLRNEWTNYTNYPYKTIPGNIEIAPQFDDNSTTVDSNNLRIGPFTNPDGSNTGYFITGSLKVENQKNILQTMGILLDGNYRENTLTSGYWNYVDKYMRSSGGAKDGLYFYNFGLTTGEYQPTGAINSSKFKLIEFEYTTYVPPIDLTNSNQRFICDSSGNPIGVLKSNYKLYNYSFNLIVQEERYNILSFCNGYSGLLYAR